MVALLIFADKQNGDSIDRILDFTEKCSDSSTIYLVIKTLRRLSNVWLGNAWVEQLQKRPVI